MFDRAHHDPDTSRMAITILAETLLVARGCPHDRLSVAKQLLRLSSEPRAEHECAIDALLEAVDNAVNLATLD